VTTSDHIERLAKRLKEANRPFVIATVVRTEDMTSAKSGAKALIDDQGGIEGWVGGGCAQPAVRTAALQAIDDGRARLIRVRPGEVENTNRSIEEYEAHCHSGGTLDIFVEPVLPRPWLLVLGASPVGQVLARLAQEVGYRVAAACSAEDGSLYPGVERLVVGFELGDAAEPGSAVVVATQGRGDRTALEAALATDTGYCAFVASRRKAAKVKEELVESGCDAIRVNAIRAPAGIDITAVTPEEVAVSILGEMIQFRRASLAQAQAKKMATAKAMDNDETNVIVDVVSQASCGDPEGE
jgi:xanthine dehydrogenase accessory factor